MNRKQFVTTVTAYLDECGYRKHVPAQRATFKIMDENGKVSNFVAKKESAGIKLTKDDVEQVLAAMLAVIVDCIKTGEGLNISTYFNLHLHKRAARMAPHPATGELMEMKEHFIVKLDPYAKLKTAAAVYSARCEEIKERAENIIFRKESNQYDDVFDREEVIEYGGD